MFRIKVKMIWNQQLYNIFIMAMAIVWVLSDDERSWMSKKMLGKRVIFKI